MDLWAFKECKRKLQRGGDGEPILEKTSLRWTRRGADSGSAYLDVRGEAAQLVFDVLSETFEFNVSVLGYDIELHQVGGSLGNGQVAQDVQDAGGVYGVTAVMEKGGR